MTTFTGRVHRDNLDLLRPLPVRHPGAGVRPGRLRADQGQRPELPGAGPPLLPRRGAEQGPALLDGLRGTPYAHPEDGYVQSVRSITLDDVRQFYRDNYTRDNVVVAVGGGYPRVRPARPATSTGSPPAESPRRRRRGPSGRRVKVLIVETNTAATAISMGFPIDLLRGDDDFIAMLTANSWFGEHRNSFSHLYQVIRETRGMNYGTTPTSRPSPAATPPSSRGSTWPAGASCSRSGSAPSP
jgi:zinc protease